MTENLSAIQKGFRKLKTLLGYRTKARHVDLQPYAEQLDYLWEKRVKQLTIDQAEAENMPDESCGRPEIIGIPFGYINDRWARLLAKMQDNDELWTYSDYHGGRSGSMGIMLCRNSKVIATIVTVRF